MDSKVPVVRHSSRSVNKFVEDPRRLGLAGVFKIVSVKAPAKINLALDMLGKRPDGYHELKTVMQTLALCDTLTMIRRGTLGSVRLTTDDPNLPTDEGNLVTRAARFLMDEYRINNSGVCIHLKKRIPIAAGLGGGSSDCAAALIGLNKLFDLNISIHNLVEIGRLFGADVPFCVLGGTALAEGIGEKLTPLAPHPPCWVILANPGIAVSTAEVFNRYTPTLEHPPINQMIEALDIGDSRQVAACFGNVLTDTAAKMHPVIAEILNQMIELGAYGASMSGSGPTVYGLFDNDELAKSAQHKLGLWVKKVMLTNIW